MDDGFVIVLECSCGVAVDYPGHRQATSECLNCGRTYEVEKLGAKRERA